MVVGDDDQSIYSWRGADIRNILDFEKDYPEATVVRLEQNYRSTKTILAAANHVVANNADRKPKTLWTANVEGEAITRYLASDERDEARFVVDEIERLLSSEHRSYADFAVFYRTNAQSRVLEDQFLRSGVPYQLVGGTRFFERAEIRDVMAYLRAVANPSDPVPVRRVINTPRRGIGDATIAVLEDAAYRERIPLQEAVMRAGTQDWLGAGPRAKVASFAKTPRADARGRGRSARAHRADRRAVGTRDRTARGGQRRGAWAASRTSTSSTAWCRSSWSSTTIRDSTTSWSGSPCAPTWTTWTRASARSRS